MNEPFRKYTERMRAERSTIAFALLLIALVALAYIPAYRAGFIWDDDLHVTANPVIVGPQGLREIWTTPAANYFPLTMTAFWTLHALFGLDPLPYHIVNVALHLASALLLWAVLRRLRIPGAWLGAAFWALHPVQVESVAWISELKNTLSAVFFLLAIGFYVRWLEAGEREIADADADGSQSRPTSRAGLRPASETVPVTQAEHDSHAHARHPRFFYVLALVFGICAVLSKSSTVMLPVVLFLVAWWLCGRWPWRRLIELVPFFAVSLAISGWTIWEQKYSSGAAGAEWSHSLADRFSIAGRVPWFYLGKLLWPEPLIFIYPRWQTGGASWGSLLPGVALLAVGIWLLLTSQRSAQARAAFFGLSLFVVLLFPVLGFFDVYFFRFSFVGDHFQYLASMAALPLAAAVVVRLPASPRSLAASALVLCLGFLTFQQARIYRSDLTLFGATVADNPDAWMAHNNLSGALAETGNADAAIAHARRALELRRDYPEAESNLGRALTLAGRPAEALPHLERAVHLDSRYSEAHTNHGIALAALGRDAEALAAFEAGIAANPADDKPRYNLGLALAKSGRFAEALPHFAEAVRLNPGNAPAEMSRGLALTASGRFADAVPHLERAIRIAPHSADVHAGYGRALAVAGRLDEAQTRLRHALQLDPNYADAHLNLGLILQHLGRTDEARKHLDAARRLGAGN